MKEQRTALPFTCHRAFQIKYRICVLLSAVLAAAGLRFGGISAQAARQEVIHTELTGEGQNLTLRIELAADANVTSGRIQVFYPRKLAELSEVKSGAVWRVMDTDTDLKEGEKRGVSYAWADTKAQTEDGTLLSVTMKAKDGAVGKKITVETEVIELFAGDKEVEPAKRRISDSLTLESGENPKPGEPVDPEPEAPVSAGTEPAGTGTAAPSAGGAAVSNVHTGDDANPAGYALLGMGALLLMADLAKKKWV